MDARVAIVGAGPAGALLAYLLASRGVDTLLIERQSDFSREFRGELLMPSGIHALLEAGVRLDDIATSVPSRIEAYINGRRFLAVETEPMGPFRPTAVSQPELLEALVGLANETGAFRLLRGSTVRKLERDDSGATTLHLRHEGRAGEETLRVPFLIGADGRGSMVRRHLSPPVVSRSTPLDIVWCKMPYPESWPEAQARVELGRGNMMIILCSPDGLLQVAWVILKGTYGELKSRGIEAWIDAMAEHADPELAEHLRRNRDRTSRPFLLNAVADRVQGWSVPGALLIGDAAHTMSPVGAQGINLALRDAIVAANELVPALRDAGDVNAAAARVEALRGREIDRVQRMASIPPRLVMGRTGLHELGRRLFARMATTPLFGAMGAKAASVFLDGVTEVHLTV